MQTTSGLHLHSALAKGIDLAGHTILMVIDLAGHTVLRVIALAAHTQVLTVAALRALLAQSDLNRLIPLADQAGLPPVRLYRLFL